MRQYTITVETERGPAEVPVIETTWKGRPLWITPHPGPGLAYTHREEKQEDG
jgi:hypothetical protein